MDHYITVFDNSAKSAEVKLALRRLISNYGASGPIFKFTQSPSMGDIIRGTMATLEDQIYEIPDTGVVMLSQVDNLVGHGGLAVYLIGFAKDDDKYSALTQRLEEMGFKKQQQRDLLAEVDALGEQLKKR